METHEIYVGIYDNDNYKYTLDCGPITGVVEHFCRLDEDTGEEYALCYLEMMGTKISETECYAKNKKEGFNTVAIMIMDFYRNLEESVNLSKKNYKVKKEK